MIVQMAFLSDTVEFVGEIYMESWVFGFIFLVGMVSLMTVMKTSDHSAQKLFTLSTEKMDVGKHSRVVLAVSKSACL